MTNSYCSTNDVANAVGVPLDTVVADSVLADRLMLAALLGSGYVDTYLSGTVADTDLTPPYTVTTVACPPSFRAAAIVAAARFFSAKDIPFGVVSVGEYGKVIGDIPEANLILRGHRTETGIA